ncbi:ABC transporter permease [Devosia sp. 2618]|uniref:ABC transporter permease n=1 Tax=Devosia sp. 2618 TaxID=3156454 RepID=UPI003394A70C
MLSSAVFIVRRLLQAVPLLFAVMTTMFLLLELAPGDPIQAMVGEFPVTPEYRAQLNERFNFDAPVWERYISFIGNVATLNFGHSFANSRDVTALILERIPNTLLLTVSGLVFAAMIGIFMGVLASTSKSPFGRTSISTLALAGYSMPAFWMGQIFIMIFALWLGWFPAQGMTDLRARNVGFDHLLDVGMHLILPAAVLALREVGIITRITRASMLDAMGQDYIRTARAKGEPEHSVIWGHALRNALLPVVTVIGYGFGFALSGSVLVETVFGWPGMGRLLYDAIAMQDNAVILGIFFFIACTVVLANALTDLLYTWLDPRIDLRKGASK